MKDSLTPEQQNAERKAAYMKRVKKWREDGHELDVNEKAQLDFWNSGQTLPKCVNHGCNNLIVMRNWGNVSQKSECSACERARKNGKTIEGVTILRKKFCENIDGHCGFKCEFPPNHWKDFQSGLHLDHKDGDHFNNHPNNVETLCCVCHARKSDEKGDVNSKKPSGRKLA